VPGGWAAKINQDRGLAICPWMSDPKSGLFGVYDGHGCVGEMVSEFVLHNLPRALRGSCAMEPGQALSEAYLKVDTSLAADANVDATVSGTTAVTCLLKENKVWIANSGDSRAIVVQRTSDVSTMRALDLTIDHKPDSPCEKKRILRMGGRVTTAGTNGSPVSRAWHNGRGLAMARSIGDHAAATVGVILGDEYSLGDDDFCIVIASDGVWDMLGSQTVASCVASVKSGGVQDICDAIVDRASHMWQRMAEDGYRDDITVLVLMLQR